MTDHLFFVKAKFRAPKAEPQPIVGFSFRHGIFIHWYTETEVQALISGALLGDEESLAMAFIATKEELEKTLKVAQGDSDVEYLTVRRIR